MIHAIKFSFLKKPSDLKIIIFYLHKPFFYFKEHSPKRKFENKIQMFKTCIFLITLSLEANNLKNLTDING